MLKRILVVLELAPGRLLSPRHLPAETEEINGKKVIHLTSRDKWNLNTKLYHNKYQLNKMKKVELLEYNEENTKHYRLSDMTEGDDDYNEVLNWYNEYEKEKGEKIAEIKNIIEKLYPDTRPKKKSRRSAAPEVVTSDAPRGGRRRGRVARCLMLPLTLQLLENLIFHDAIGAGGSGSLLMLLSLAHHTNPT